MINKKYLKLLRSQQRFDENNFIYKIIARRIIDSLDLLNIRFNKILEIGINENKTYNYLERKFHDLYFDRADLCLSKLNVSNRYNFIEIDLQKLFFKNNFYNLIFSNCFMHLSNNFEKNLSVVLNSLEPNGFFIAAIPDKESMFQLLNSMYETDLFIYKGAYQRSNSTIEIDNVLPIFKKLKFDSPTVYSDKFTLEYSSFKNLIKEIKSMNLSYCYKDKRQKFENKKYLKLLESFYKKNYFNKNYILDIKINIISAWKK